MSYGIMFHHSDDKNGDTDLGDTYSSMKAAQEAIKRLAAGLREQGPGSKMFKTPERVEVRFRTGGGLAYYIVVK